MHTAKKIIKKIKEVVGEENKKLSIHEPSFAKSNAYKYIKDCIDTGWVSTSGNWVSDFESKIASFTGSKHVVAVSNGTVALRLALYLADVRANDEVFIPPMSFVATANAVSHLGAFPHFIDIEKDTLGMCPLALEKRLNEIAIIEGEKIINRFTGKKISAVLPVHVFGTPAKIEEIKKICLKWNLPLLEDAAEALGSRVINANKKKHCGLFGKAGVLSFNGNKIITTGGGGALLINDESTAKLAKHLSTTAKVDHPWEFFHDQIAWNDRMPNINAALGVSQIEKLQTKLHFKKILHSKFKSVFEDSEDLEILQARKNCESNYWLNTLRILGNNSKEIKEEILYEAHKSEIFLRPVWSLLNKLPMYKDCQSGNLDQAYNQSQRIINLPSSPQLIGDC